MATYYGTYGQKVQYLASDPSDPQIGQVWYNSTSAVLKVRQAVVTNAWATGGNLNTARTTAAGAGTQTAALGFGGYAPGLSAASESYNGTAWTNTPSLNTARRVIMGSGLQTAALAFGGLSAPGTGTNSTATELWNGSTWTNNPTGLPVANHAGASAGTQTATLMFGGNGYKNTTVSFNGSTWTAVPGTLNTARTNNSGCGTQTAALGFGGYTPGAVTGSTELWNGTSWTANPTGLNTIRAAGGGAGIQTLAISFGGYTPPGVTNSGATELWNGSTWTTSPGSMATARYSVASSLNGTQTSALVFGGFTTGPSAATEEWTGTVISNKTITVS